MKKSIYLMAAFVLVGCGDAPSLDIELVPDPNVNSEAQILDRVESLVFIFDSVDGLYLPGDEYAAGNVQVVDADADPTDLELVATFPLGDHLPIVRLEEADLPDVAIDVRVLGESGLGPIAEGRVLGARFSFGDGAEPVRIPFNIRPEHLPPRVGEVIPNDGQIIQGCQVQTVVVMFSKPIDPASLFLPGAVVFEPGGAPREIRLDGTGIVAQIEPPPIEGAGTVSYRLRIESLVVDPAGIRLDQVAAEDSSQPYVGDFTLRCRPQTGTPTPPRCGSMAPPGPLSPVCPAMPRLMCVDDECVPTGCEIATCEDGLICDDAVGLCVQDCRSYGDVSVCPVERPTCEPTTGVCVP